MREDYESEMRFVVVINDEDQYSIWEDSTTPPSGWYTTGFAGTKAECLAHIDEVWTDMRPRSLREAMESGELEHDSEAEDDLAAILADDTPDLLTRLSDDDHPVELVLRPAPSLAALRETIARDYVLVKFTGTRGGTELGVPLDRQRSDLAAADLGSGRIYVHGDIVLDGNTAQVSAIVDVSTLNGTGRLIAGRGAGDDWSARQSAR